ncbi:MAG TPA: amino acid permease [Bacteroidota bacterium]|nr:amino acid permease [Bacteroidota bacterium]
MADDHEHAFRRELKVLDSTMLVMGSMIGSGIFIVSADIARTVGGPGLLLLVWLITGLVTVTAALSYGELAGMMPHAGGQYVYLREAYNPLIGFLYGWTLFLVIQSGTIAAVAVAFAKFTALLVPALGESTVLLTVFHHSVTAAQLVAIATILVLTLINMRGIHGGRLVQNTFTIAKTTALFGLIVVGLLLAHDHYAFTANLSRFWEASRTEVSQGVVSTIPLTGFGILMAIGAAMVGSLFSSDAWNNITFTAAEVVNPRRTIPVSLVLGTGIVTLLYLLANVAYLGVLPFWGTPQGADVLSRGMQFASSDRVATAAAWVMLGPPAAILMAVLIMVSTFGCNNGLILAGARVQYAMANDGLFFRKCGTLNRHGVPGVALVIQAVWASLLCLSGSYSDLLDYVVFAVLIFYALTVAGIFVLRRRRPDAERPYRALGYPLIPAVYILAALAIAADLLVVKPDFTWPGMIIVLLGIPVYYVWVFLRRGTAGL